MVGRYDGVGSPPVLSMRACRCGACIRYAVGLLCPALLLSPGAKVNQLLSLLFPGFLFDMAMEIVGFWPSSQHKGQHHPPARPKTNTRQPDPRPTPASKHQSTKHQAATAFIVAWTTACTAAWLHGCTAAHWHRMRNHRCEAHPSLHITRP